jgi:hypothetical protein
MQAIAIGADHGAASDHNVWLKNSAPQFCCPASLTDISAGLPATLCRKVLFEGFARMICSRVSSRGLHEVLLEVLLDSSAGHEPVAHRFYPGKPRQISTQLDPGGVIMAAAQTQARAPVFAVGSCDQGLRIDASVRVRPGLRAANAPQRAHDLLGAAADDTLEGVQAPSSASTHLTCLTGKGPYQYPARQSASPSAVQAAGLPGYDAATNPGLRAATMASDSCRGCPGP